MPLATVSSRLQRALIKLRAQLDEDAGPRWRASLAVAVGLPASLGKVNAVSPHAKLLWSLTMTQATAAIALGTAALVLGGIFYLSSSTSVAPKANAVDSVQRPPKPESLEESAPPGQVIREPVAGPATQPARIRLVANLQWPDGSPARAQRATLRGEDRTATGPVIVSEQRSIVEFPNLSPGAYSLRIAGSSREHALQIEAGPAGTDSIVERTIELTPVAEFRGRVTSSEGAPIAGAWITGGGWDVLGVSDSGGMFRVRSLQKVRTFACRAQGYAASTYRPCPATGEEAHVVLSPGGAVLEGWVMDPDNEPAAFATVMTLRLESHDHLARIHAEFDHLERDPACYGLTLFRQPNRSHATFADGFDQRVAIYNIRCSFAGKALRWLVHESPRHATHALAGCYPCAPATQNTSPRSMQIERGLACLWQCLWASERRPAAQAR